MKYVSIDIETTGLKRIECDVIEFAAVIEDTCASIPVKELPRFHRFIKTTPAGQWEDVARKWNYDKWITEIQSGNFIDHTILAHQFQKWLCVNGLNPASFTVAGKNFATFDIEFLNKLPNWKELLQHHRRVMDPSILFFDPSKDDVLPDTKECLKRAGFINLDSVHSALDDARMIILLLRTGLARK